jgi:hypothetical protein
MTRNVPKTSTTPHSMDTHSRDASWKRNANADHMSGKARGRSAFSESAQKEKTEKNGRHLRKEKYERRIASFRAIFARE